ncbi:hypothetical protein N7508_001392 [Penicillium antarcticum]|uniref:uncharacterized protein n=1 Tax=Penicillium antarcticum TaxID=416450 RepID=UPI0023955D9A|nr:uncharacterized protein N7508_001392 [Penicillium antarcticum]KAJ5316884.1 hypothetical protein N7508_001392 [Penicillium antarcticum]
MPGVPSSRACDECRKRKKKATADGPTQCNLAMPVCARCAQLKIKCFGVGQQRYKFINRNATGLEPLRIVSSNRTTLITGHLISRLEVRDIRYDTNCFGAFLHLIPKRIGANNALDIAADTFATVYSNLHLDQYPVQALVKHGKALTALRDCLKMPLDGQVAEIATAIYFTMLNDVHGISSQGMTAHWNWKSKFELETLLTLTGIVVMESLGNPRINLEPWVWNVLEKVEAPKSAEDRHLHTEAMRKSPDRFPSLELRRIIETIQMIREPAHRSSDLQFNYNLLLSDLEKLNRLPKSLFFNNEPSTDQPSPQIQLGNQTRLATVLTLALMVNTVLQESSSLDTNLLSENDMLVEESIAVSQIPDRYMPLGACYVTPCLIAACAASHNPKQQAVIAGLLGEISTTEGTPTTCVMDGVGGWRRKWEDMRRQVPGRPLLSAAICRHAGG